MAGRTAFDVSKITAEQLENLASQYPHKFQIATALGISESTFYEKVNSVPEFADAINRGRNELAKKALKSMQDILSDADNKNAFLAAQYILDKVCRKKFNFAKVDLSDRKNVDEIANAIFSAASDAEINAEEAEKLLNIVKKHAEIRNNDLEGRLAALEQKAGVNNG